MKNVKEGFEFFFIFPSGFEFFLLGDLHHSAKTKEQHSWR